MTYTLLSSPVLAFELAHLPAGPTVAQALLTGLAADGDIFVEFEPRLRPGTRSTSAGPVRLAGLDATDPLLAEAATPEQVMSALKRIRLGGPQDLERLIRNEMTSIGGAEGSDLRAWVVDAVTACALHHWGLSGGPEERLPRDTEVLPRDSWLHRTDHDLGPHTAAVLDLLGSLTVSATRSSWRVSQSNDRQAWATAMHQATWAAHLSNRVVPAARAQLLGVLAFREAGFGSREVSSGAWNVLSGVLQAVVVSDLLDSASLDVLLAPVADRPGSSRPSSRPA